MVLFDFDTKILHGDEPVSIFNPKVSIGHIIVHHLRKYPDRVMQVCSDDGREMTCGEIAELSTNFAKNMLKDGFKEGDVVGIIGKNSSFIAPAIFGCFLIAAPVSLLELRFDNFSFVFDITEPKIIFCDNDIAESVDKYVQSTKRQIRVVTITQKLDGFSHVSDYFRENKDFKIPVTMKTKASKTVAAMLLTSGTTAIHGAVKVAQISHTQLVDNKMLYGDSLEIFSFSFFSFSWISGLCTLVFCALNHEKRLITTFNFHPDIFFDLLRQYRFTHTVLTPGLIHQLQQSARYEKADFSSIKIMILGGLHCSIDMRTTLKQKMPNASIKIAYGMTEISTICMTNDDNLKSVGKPFSDVQIKILLPDGSIGSLNQTGDILLRKPYKMFLGYLKNDAKTTEALDGEGWLHTGDMGFIDDSLNLTIVGRKAFAIKTLSNILMPTEIEDILNAIKGVKISCVVGLPNENQTDDELPTALIIKNDLFEVSETTINDALANLADYKKLRGGVYFVESFILSETRKIYRFPMREKALELRKATKLVNKIPVKT